ncbi:hypothetical protein EZS27_016555 [termite gut metagenome]|uniref:Uncharacterized protein n=1 Tax=termite gut metagenome TaxID=433724 RepID=A0A5J4RM18_9ZZZZ
MENLINQTAQLWRQTLWTEGNPFLLLSSNSISSISLYFQSVDATMHTRMRCY